MFIGLFIDIYRIIFQVAHQPQAQVTSECIRILETGSGHISGQFRTVLCEQAERFRWTNIHSYRPFSSGRICFSEVEGEVADCAY